MKQTAITKLLDKYVGKPWALVAKDLARLPPRIHPHLLRKIEINTILDERGFVVCRDGIPMAVWKKYYVCPQTNTFLKRGGIANPCYQKGYAISVLNPPKYPAKIVGGDDFAGNVGTISPTAEIATPNY